MATVTVTLPTFPCPNCGTTVWEVEAHQPKGETEGDEATVTPVPGDGVCANGHPA